MIKIFVGGSRIYTNYPIFRRELLSYLDALSLATDEITLLSGGAHGVDSLAEHFSEEFSIPLTVVEPDWETHGKSAGVKRTIYMFDEFKPDYAFLVWDGASKGTKHTRNIAEARNVPTRIHYFTNPAVNYAKFSKRPVLRTDRQPNGVKRNSKSGKVSVSGNPGSRTNRTGTSSQSSSGVRVNFKPRTTSGGA